jgi:hypothetical protein
MVGGSGQSFAKRGSGGGFWPVLAGMGSLVRGGASLARGLVGVGGSAAAGVRGLVPEVVETGLVGALAGEEQGAGEGAVALGQ